MEGSVANYFLVLYKLTFQQNVIAYLTITKQCSTSFDMHLNREINYALWDWPTNEGDVARAMLLLSLLTAKWNMDLTQNQTRPNHKSFLFYSVLFRGLLSVLELPQSCLLFSSGLLKFSHPPTVLLNLPFPFQLLLSQASLLFLEKR